MRITDHFGARIMRPNTADLSLPFCRHSLGSLAAGREATTSKTNLENKSTHKGPATKSMNPYIM